MVADGLEGLPTNSVKALLQLIKLGCKETRNTMSCTCMQEAQPLIQYRVKNITCIN